MIRATWRRLADSAARWSLRAAPDQDWDRVAYRRSVIGIAHRVAGVSAALVVGIILLVVAYVVWQLTPGQQHERPGPFDVHITLDTVDLTVAVLGVGGLAIIFAGIASWVIARRAVRPLTEALRVQRTFVADASHELRTPLAVLHARVQRLRMMVPTDDPRRSVVNDVSADTRILIDIVNDLLEAAAGTPTVQGVAHLEDAMDALRRDMSVLADERHVRLRVESHRSTAAISPTQLQRCLIALTDNAIGHTPPGGTVTVSAVQERDRVCVRVQDTGGGITGIEPSRIFDRFAHGAAAVPPGSAETRTGYGIGLALVRDIAVRVGGDVTVEATGTDGSTFALRLPTTLRPEDVAPDPSRPAEG